MDSIKPRLTRSPDGSGSPQRSEDYKRTAGFAAQQLIINNGVSFRCAELNYIGGMIVY
jgi:hypothetical protein